MLPAGDAAELSATRGNLSCGVRGAKKRNPTAETHGACGRGSRPSRATNLSTQACDSDIFLLNQLHNLFARFDALSNTPAQKTPLPPKKKNPQKNQNQKDPYPWLTPRKAAFVETLCRRAQGCPRGHLRHLLESGCCLHMLQSHHHHTCAKGVNPHPAPMTTVPVALTSSIMKCFKRLVVQGNWTRWA